MAVLIELPRDANKICRTCISVLDEPSPANALFCDNKPTDLCEKFKTFTAIEVTEEDHLPNVMCNTCVQSLQFCISFQDQCRANDRTFVEIVNCKSAEQMFKRKSLLCAICGVESASHYSHSQHMLTHNRNASLFDRYVEAHGATVETPPDVEDVRDLILASKNACGKKQRAALNSICDLMYSDEEICEDEEVVNAEESFKDELEGVVKTEESSVCSICNRVFGCLNRFLLHFLKHASCGSSTNEEHFHFCSFCGLIFETKAGLSTHFSTHVAEKVAWVCTTCNKKYKSEFALLKHETMVNHVQTNETSVPFTCPFCSQPFDSKEQLVTHSILHLVKKHNCRKCKQQFITEQAYHVHLRSHPKFGVICNICGKHLTSNSSLQQHMLGMHKNIGKNLYECKICNKGFPTRNRLLVHHQIHRKDKNYACDYCPYRTAKVSDLTVHIRKHTAERPYKCTYANCGKMFKTSSHLADHVRRHLGIKRYKCGVCTQAFSSVSGLKKHLKVHMREVSSNVRETD